MQREASFKLDFSEAMIGLKANERNFYIPPIVHALTIVSYYFYCFIPLI